MTRIITVALALLTFTVSGCAIMGQRDGSFAEAFGGSTTVSENGGGDVRIFTYAAEEVLRKGIKVRIDGRCDSACALFADLARPNVCVTENARFGFHKMLKSQTYTSSSMFMNATISTTVQTVQKREDPPHSQDIATWVNNRWGFPSYGLLVMKAEDATEFWPTCSN